MSDNMNEDKTVKDVKEIVTEEDVKSVVKCMTGDDSIKVLEYRLKSLSEEKLGLLGSHRSLRVTVQKEDSSETKTLRFFVKSIPYESAEQSGFIISQGFFTKEASFFRTILPELTKDFKAEKWYPTCYLVRDDVIIMEDLRLSGYMMLGRFYNDYTALKSMLGSMARFHACSILTETRLSQDSEHTVTLKEKYSNYFKETMFVKNAPSTGWFKSNARVASVIAEKLGRNPEKVRSAFNRIYELIEPSEIHRNVICHGDLWSNNIMCDESTPLRKCVYVDFQIFRYAPMVLDVLQLLHTNSSRAFRAKTEKRLIEFYHLSIEETVKMSDLSESALVPALHEILAAMNDLRLYGAILACLYSVLGPKIATECAKTDDGYRKFISGEDVTDIVLTYMVKDKVYKEDVEDAILELADISEHL